jgi:hypothetical protein
VNGTSGPLDAQAMAGAFAAASHPREHYCESWQWRDRAGRDTGPFIACVHRIAVEVEMAA